MPFQSRFQRIGELHREVMIGEEGLRLMTLLRRLFVPRSLLGLIVTRGSNILLSLRCRLRLTEECGMIPKNSGIRVSLAGNG